MAQQTLLTLNHVQEVLNQNILIGADSAAQKRFTFNPQKNEYSIYHRGEYLMGGQALEELLDVYNNLK